jgi:8-hydroxy-5-deazaflavin:NADPH oxidoreductase
MKIGVLGTGMVGDTIASKLVSLGHEVKMGSRSATNEKALAWQKKAGAGASAGTFADAAAFGEILFGCLNGGTALEALKQAGAENLKGKILVDLANPLDGSKGFPPTLSVVNDDSLGERIQRAFPEARVVKTLNTVNVIVMVDPGKLAGGDHTMFMAGNDAEAKGRVREILTAFGWRDVIDLGDITNARGLEMYLPLWVRLFGHFKSPAFSVKVVRGS